MDREEVNLQLMRKAKQGDRRAYEEFFELNYPLCRHIAKKFYGSHVDFDDLCEIAALGLLKAYKAYDETKDTKFITFASRCMTNQILMYVRSKSGRINDDMSMEEVIHWDSEGGDLTLQELLADPTNIEELIEKDELHHIVNMYLAELKPKWRTAIELHFFQGLTQREVAAAMNSSQSMVSRWIKRGCARIKKRLNKEQLV